MLSLIPKNLIKSLLTQFLFLVRTEAVVLIFESFLRRASLYASDFEYTIRSENEDEGCDCWRFFVGLSNLLLETFSRTFRSSSSLNVKSTSLSSLANSSKVLATTCEA